MPLIYPTHDPRRHDTRLFKGGDGGAAEMRQEEQARQDKVQAGVDSINRLFGVGGGTTGRGPAPDRAKFTKPTGQQVVSQQWMGGGDGGYQDVMGPSGEVFDEAGYNQALAAYQTEDAAVGQNKTVRERQYADLADAVKTTAMRDVDRQFGKASKENTFGLARAGLLGGSVDAESGGQLQELYGEGRLKATNAGQQAAAELRGTDEKTRQNLIGLAQSGLDTGTASSMAAGQLSAAAEVAKTNANQASVGDLFGNMGQAYLMNKQIGARFPQGIQPPQSGYSSNVFNPNGYSGRVTQ